MTMLSRTRRSMAALAISAAIAASAVACTAAKEDQPARTMAPSSASTAPTEKNVKPSMGPNSFSPTATARPAPTALPGNVNTG